MIYTSEKLENMEIENFESITEGGRFEYQLTEAELGWVDWIGDRYAIAELIADNISEAGVVTLEPYEVSEALSADGVDRAPCLSEDTQLARLIWYIGPEE